MKRFLRSLLNFLDRKFPDKVVVTQAAYEKLSKDLLTHGMRIQQLEAETFALKNQMANINMAIGFSTPKVGILER